MGIGDVAETRLASSTGSFDIERGAVFQIRVNGTATTSSDATLSALALEDASDDSAIAISPVFASGTTSYTASVLNGVDEITIDPTVNESNATVEYLDSSDTEIADADGVKAGQQVSLSVGANTIKVKVTAQDATTNTYTVVVTRAANTPATGEPAIIGTARVGRTLTASDLDIMDVDGLPSASTFTYQWLRKVGATSTSISGANSITYTLQAADLGNRVAVRVSFIDRAGNSEMRTSGDYPTSGTVLANNTLVSNVGQTLINTLNLTTYDLAQSFTTGANPTGYTLSNIELHLRTASGVSASTPTVTLHSVSATGTEVATFGGPAMLATNGTKNYTFTPTTTVTLLTSTTYWVVAKGGNGDWVYTASDSEDANSATGWSIAGGIAGGTSFRDAGTTGSFTLQSNSSLYDPRQRHPWRHRHLERRDAERACA